MKDKELKGDDSTGVPNIDRLIHEPARLYIVAHLYVVKRADFLFLKQRTGLTWGNLSSHMSKLEDAGYIEIEKGFVGKKPNSRVRLTDKGRITFEKYRKDMSQLFEDDMQDDKTKVE